MNYFKITMIGESPLEHEDIHNVLEHFVDCFEGDIKGEIGVATYSPIDEHGQIVLSYPQLLTVKNELEDN